MKYRLYAPGTRKSQSWVARGYVNGSQVEVSCRTADRGKAEHFAHEFFTNLKAFYDKTTPKAREIGDFEQSLLDNYYWHEGHILHRRGGVLRFYKAAHGYRSAKIIFMGEKRTMLEHRMVFLLVHKWLPESIDHINRDRADNRPSNLRAATPRSQGNNRGIARTKICNPLALND